MCHEVDDGILFGEANWFGATNKKTINESSNSLLVYGVDAGALSQEAQNGARNLSRKAVQSGWGMQVLGVRAGMSWV